MQDTNWKVWLLVFVVAIGAAFEGLKRLPKGGSESWDFENLKFSASDLNPYHVRKTKRFKGEPPAVMPMGPVAQRVGGVSAEPVKAFEAADTPKPADETKALQAATAAGEKELAKLKKKKKLKDDEEWEIITDPRSGKKYRRRKKKVTKVEPPPVQVANTEEKKEEEDEDDDSNDVGTLLDQAIATGTVQVPKVKVDSPSLDLEGWKRKLLTHPDRAETLRFIEAYKKNLVSSDVFYKIVQMMIEDSRPQMKELGVLCAGLTPSVMSFTVLAEIWRTQPTSSTLRKYADGFLSKYSELSNLSILARILRSPSSSSVAVLALQKLEQAANTYLSPALNKPPKNATPQQLARHSNAGYFQQFLLILNSLSRSQGQVSAQAQTTLTNLNQLINIGGNAPAMPGSTPGPAAHPASQQPAQASTQPL